VESWIEKQTGYNISQWDKSIEMHYPHYLKMWHDPVEHYRCIKKVWNLLDAVKCIDWSRFLRMNGLTILDLGSGTGWLSAFLSDFDQVKKIYAVDSSSYFLNNMMAEIIKFMNGKKEKITPIQGLFTPLILEDKSLDIVVISSALHHAENIEDVLNEIWRVLKDDGYLFILNETPFNKMQYVQLNVRVFLNILKSSIFQEYKRYSQQQSAGGVLLDPYLGDKCYPSWYWIKVIQSARFTIQEMMVTPYTALKKSKKRLKLTHFICKKNT
jgi:ubiquinone/menaquinone biosynthesis C-methylase UbiE